MNYSESRERIVSGLSSVKIAGLWKRSQCLHRYTKPNYRHRVFILTKQALSYYSGTLDKIGSLKGRIGIDCIRAVEVVDNAAFGLEHTMQVIYQSKKHGYVTLYVTARNKEECDDWVTTLRKACCFNAEMLMHYHPGSYTRSNWSCCKQRNRQTLGCEPTHYLLSKSSSRYAEMRRRENINRLSYQSMHESQIISHRPSLPLIIEEEVPIQERSNSCHNLTCHTFPSNFSDVQTVSSCYTLNTVSDSMDLNDPSGLSHDTKIDTHQIPNGDIHRRHHQVAPEIQLATPVMEISPKSGKPNSDSTQSEQVPSKRLDLSETHQISLSREPSVDYNCLSLPRKPSIEPRLSNTNPELIHV